MPRLDVPGPKAREYLDRDKEVISPSYPRAAPFVMARGQGVEVWDVDGNRYLDFMAGIAVTSTGHSHPKVVQASDNGQPYLTETSETETVRAYLTLVENMVAQLAGS